MCFATQPVQPSSTRVLFANSCCTYQRCNDIEANLCARVREGTQAVISTEKLQDRLIAKSLTEVEWQNFGGECQGPSSDKSEQTSAHEQSHFHTHFGATAAMGTARKMKRAIWPRLLTNNSAAKSVARFHFQSLQRRHASIDPS
jgi:hypothetical protein